MPRLPHRATSDHGHCADHHVQQLVRRRGPGSNPALAGLTLHHAAVVLDTTPSVTATTPDFQIDLIP